MASLVKNARHGTVTRWEVCGLLVVGPTPPAPAPPMGDGSWGAIIQVRNYRQYPIGSMVLLYMVTWIPLIYPFMLAYIVAYMDPMGMENSDPVSAPPLPHCEVQGFQHRHHRLPERRDEIWWNGWSKPLSHRKTGEKDWRIFDFQYLLDSSTDFLLGILSISNISKHLKAAFFDQKTFSFNGNGKSSTSSWISHPPNIQHSPATIVFSSGIRIYTYLEPFEGYLTLEYIRIH